MCVFLLTASDGLVCNVRRLRYVGIASEQGPYLVASVGTSDRLQTGESYMFMVLY